MLRTEQLEKGKGIEIGGIFIPEKIAQKANVFSDDVEEASYTDVHLELEDDAKKLISEQYPEYVDDQHYEPAIINEMGEKCKMIGKEERERYMGLDNQQDCDVSMALYGAVHSALSSLLDAKLDLADEHKDKTEKDKGIEIAGIFIPEEIVRKAEMGCKNAEGAAAYIGTHFILEADAKRIIAVQYPEYAGTYYDPSIIDKMFEKITLIQQEKCAYVETLDDPKARVAAAILYGAVYRAMWNLVYRAMWNLLQAKLDLADDEESYEDD